MCMKWACMILVLVLCDSAMVQAQQTAHPTYAKNGVLIGLSALAPLRSCSIRAMEGKVKSVKNIGDAVVFILQTNDERMTFQFPIKRLASAEQKVYERGFLEKGLKLRASGYSCRSYSALEA